MVGSDAVQETTLQLRVGVTRDRGFLFRTCIRPPTSVTVGSGPSALLRIDDPDVPVEYTLFSVGRTACLLDFRPGWAVRLFRDDTPVSGEELLAEGTAFRRGDRTLLQMTPGTRGAIRIGGVRILFKWEEVPTADVGEVPLRDVGAVPRCHACGLAMRDALAKEGLFARCDSCRAINRFVDPDAPYRIVAPHSRGMRVDPADPLGPRVPDVSASQKIASLEEEADTMLGVPLFAPVTGLQLPVLPLGARPAGAAGRADTPIDLRAAREPMKALEGMQTVRARNPFLGRRPVRPVVPDSARGHQAGAGDNSFNEDTTPDPARSRRVEPAIPRPDDGEDTIPDPARDRPRAAVPVDRDEAQAPAPPDLGGRDEAWSPAPRDARAVVEDAPSPAVGATVPVNVPSAGPDILAPHVPTDTHEERRPRRRGRLPQQHAALDSDLLRAAVAEATGGDTTGGDTTGGDADATADDDDGGLWELKLPQATMAADDSLRDISGVDSDEDPAAMSYDGGLADAFYTSELEAMAPRLPDGLVPWDTMSVLSARSEFEESSGRITGVAVPVRRRKRTLEDSAGVLVAAAGLALLALGVFLVLFRPPVVVPPPEVSPAPLATPGPLTSLPPLTPEAPSPREAAQGRVKLAALSYVKTLPDDPTPVSVRVEAFRIDRREVTVAEYRAFLGATGRTEPTAWAIHRPSNEPNAPMTGASYPDAEDFCLWAGGRLPSESEWERAAAGGEGRAYPWGNQLDPGRAATGDSLAAVGSHPDGTSAEGVHDLIGNAVEWVKAPAGVEPFLKGGGAAPWNRREYLGISPRILPTAERWAPGPGFRCAAR